MKPNKTEAEDIARHARETSLRNVGLSRNLGPYVSELWLFRSRIASAGVVGLYIWLTGGTFFELLPALVVPLAITCFPNRMAYAVGRISIVANVTRRSPPWILLALGWVVLLMPLWIRPFLWVYYQFLD